MMAHRSTSDVAVFLLLLGSVMFMVIWNERWWTHLPGLRGLWINRRHSNDTTTAESSASSEEESASEKEDKIKEKILRASLPFVHEHGWTKHAISEGSKWQTDNCPDLPIMYWCDSQNNANCNFAGAQTIGYPGTAHGLFPRGGAELIQYFYVTCNQELAVALKKETEATPADISK